MAADVALSSLSLFSEAVFASRETDTFVFFLPYAQFASSNGLDVNLGLQPISEGFGFEGAK